MNAKVSVIVPIYKTEKYIERCVRSLFEQTLEDMEYIFVNDCTPDSAMQILSSVLDNYPKRKGQVVVINQPHNMGAAKAREVGIKAATGQYIIHCDSDDWVDVDMYRAMYEKAKDDNLDILICDWYETDGRHHERITQNINSRCDLLSGLINRSISGSLWNKLVACYIYSGIKHYPTEHMMEDVAYSIQLVKASGNRIGYIPKPLYYYYNNENSVCHQSDEASCKSRCRQACVNIDTIIAYLNEESLENKYSKELVVLKNSARVFLWPLLMSNPHKYISLWRSIYPEINIRYPFTKGIDVRLRGIFFLTWLGIYPYMHKLI